MDFRVSGLFCALPLAVGLASSISASASTKPRITTTGPLRPPPKTTPPEAKSSTRRAEPAAEPERIVESAEPQLAPAPSIEEGERLDLMCFGAGAANKLDVVQGQGRGSFSGSYWSNDGTFGSISGSSSSSSTFYVPRSQDFEDQVSLFIEDGEGRIRMPRVMLPIIRGGKDGWFKLKEVTIKPNEITASIAVNILNNPKLRLDRYSGMISISGKAGDYVGPCKRLDPRVQRKQF